MSTDPSHEEITRFHRWNAIECNNLAWTLSEQPSRTPDENETMLNAAHASVFHWSQIGTDLHHARGAMLLGHVHATLGMGDTATRYARQCLEYFTPRDTPDWEIAFVHAIMAHAAFAAGDTEQHRTYHASAKKLGDAIADPEDRNIFLKTFNRIPEP